VAHRYVDFAADDDVWVCCLAVCEEVEGEDYRAIRAVFKGDDAGGCGARLYGAEYVGDAG
jgi:hypothetical protein